MSLSKLLLLPTLVKNGMRAPRDVSVAWDRYWGGIQRTGVGGDVLWDGASSSELQWCTERAVKSLNPALPVVDVGCGNGRYSRALAERFERVIGVDLSPNAVRRAEQESLEQGRASFRALDITDAPATHAFAREIGQTNVFIRGVLHVLNADQKIALEKNLRHLLGARGVFLLVETAFEGSPLDYLEFLGAVGGTLPAPVLRCVQAGLPTPTRFGRLELDRYFPAERWERLETGEVEIHAVGMHADRDLERIPGFFAALAPKS